jgi:hypothetical protein
MPVHRHVHDKMGSVYGFRAELDAWMRSRNLRAAQDTGRWVTTMGTLSFRSRLVFIVGVLFVCHPRPSQSTTPVWRLNFDLRDFFALRRKLRRSGRAQFPLTNEGSAHRPAGGSPRIVKPAWQSLFRPRSQTAPPLVGGGNPTQASRANFPTDRTDRRCVSH